MTLENLEAYGFEVHDVENLREHYARTCRLWAERLHARFDEAIAEVGEAKARLWLLYLTGCSLGFDGGSVLIYQTVATRRARGRQRAAADARGSLSVARRCPVGGRSAEKPSSHRRSSPSRPASPHNTRPRLCVLFFTSVRRMSGSLSMPPSCAMMVKPQRRQGSCNGQFQLADRDPAADPFRFRKTPGHRLHVDQDVRAEAARIRIAVGCSAFSSASEAVVTRWIGSFL